MTKIQYLLFSFILVGFASLSPTLASNDDGDIVEFAKNVTFSGTTGDKEKIEVVKHAPRDNKGRGEKAKASSQSDKSKAKRERYATKNDKSKEGIVITADEVESDTVKEEKNIIISDRKDKGKHERVKRVVRDDKEKVVTVPLTVKEDKGKAEKLILKIEDEKEKDEVIGGSKANVKLAMDDIAVLTNFVTLIHNLRKDVSDKGAEDAIMQLLANGQLQDDAIGLLQLIRKQVNHWVETWPAEEGSGCWNCKKGWSGANKASDFALEQVRQIAAMIPKYYQIAKQVKEQGGDFTVVLMQVLTAGALKDLKFFLSVMDRYEASTQKSKNDALPKLNSAAKSYKAGLNSKASLNTKPKLHIEEEI